MTILVVHGPNLNLLGEREPAVYGTLTLDELNAKQGARTWAQGVVINPGAYGHTSYALRDCIAGIKLPTVEVHLSDVEAREPFRRISTIADVCIGKISGRGPQSYFDGIDLLLKKT
jgi:3-dehydroquinate dehydratase-2